MKSHTKYLWLSTKNRYEIVNITDEVQVAIDESKVSEGLCLVNAMHITASVFTDDQDSMQEGGKVQDKAVVEVENSVDKESIFGDNVNYEIH